MGCPAHSLARRLPVRASATTRSLALEMHPVASRPADVTPQSVAARLVDPRVIQSVDHRNKRVQVSWDFAHEEIVDFYRRFGRVLEQRQYPFFAFEMYRNEQRQQRLYRAGVSRYPPGKSPHNRGMALDLIHSTRFFDLEPVEWEIIGALGKEVARKAKLRMVWGGDRREGYQPEHWELDGWAAR